MQLEPDSSSGLTFYLGTPEPIWLERTSVPLCLSYRRLRGRRSLPRARGPWVLDSGGFSELSQHGRWTITSTEYVAAVRRLASETGQLVWAAAQDWMCEPDVLARTGLTVVEHQRRTVRNYVDLHAAAPDLPFMPVLQGWTVADYLRCAQLYKKAGIDLAHAPAVGVGSICRRQASADVTAILSVLHERLGLRRLHGFGVKRTGLHRAAAYLASADSMAWSWHARRAGVRLTGCPHQRCTNCLRYALGWRTRWLKAARLVSQTGGDLEGSPAEP